MRAQRTIWQLAIPLAGAGLLAGACLRSSAPAENASRHLPPAFPVIAYLPDYRVGTTDPAAYASLTDLIYFSIQPTPAGGLDAARLTPAALDSLHALKQRNGFRLLVALGGWSRSAAFGPMATNPGARRLFVPALTRFCLDHQLDGADFDWEHPANAAEEEAYAALLAETKQAFQPHGLLLTAALAPWQKLRSEGYAALDRVHLMSYDHDGRHSTFEDARADVDRLLSQGAPRGKLCLGVPFYGRGITNRDQTLTYAEIVRGYHPAADADEAGGLYFNGIRTIQQKTRYAVENHLGGLMIWELGQDTNDDTSLLRAIQQVVSK